MHRCLSFAAAIPVSLCAAGADAQRADATIVEPETAATALDAPVTVTFDDMEFNGWTILGFQDPVWRAEGGNPGAHLNFFSDNFFIRIFNNTSPDFIGDYTQKGHLEFTADLRWRLIRFGPTDVTRDLYFAIWDNYTDANGVERKHVIFRPLGKVRGKGPNAPWRTYRVRLPDPNSDTLPGGWFYWVFDAAIEPTRTLPEGLTVRDIMSSVDRIQFTTATPGLFFGFTVFDVSVDNPTLSPLPGGPRTTDAASVEILPGARAPIGADVTTDLTLPGHSRYGQPDGRVTDADLDYFLTQWNAGAGLVADRTTAGAQPGDATFGVPDGVVDQADLDHYLGAWEAERNAAPSRRTGRITP